MPPQIIASQSSLKSAAGPFAVKPRVNTPVFSFMSMKIVPQSKPLAAGVATVWSGMGFAMAAKIEAVSSKDGSKKNRETYLYCPRVVKILEQDSHLMSPLI